MKRTSLHQWEEQWMNEKADAADQAATQGRMGSLFQIIRELSQAKEHRKRFGLRRSDNPQRPRRRARRVYRRAQTNGAPIGQRQQRAHRNAAGQWQCPVCAEVFPKPNQFTFRYESEQAVVDPSTVTVQVFTCPDCRQNYRRKRQLDQHTCPAKTKLPRLDKIDTLEQVGGPDLVNHLSAEDQIFLFTDGSGGTGQGAGWGIGVFTQAQPLFTDKWVAALYGPVILQQSDPVYLGATAHTNNTAELKGIGEACHWLLQIRCNERYPQRPKTATICYDYDYDVRQRFQKWRTQN